MKTSITDHREREREGGRERRGGCKITQSAHTSEAEVFLNVLNTTDPVKALTSIPQQVRTLPCGGLLPLQELHERQFSATAVRRDRRRRQHQQRVRQQVSHTVSQLEKFAKADKKHCTFGAQDILELCCYLMNLNPVPHDIQPVSLFTVPTVFSSP